ncbi:MAG: lytic transglycosylase domain-containing protein [Verrucomicrobia bacterium]|nr:lytic transglycosylase domain-containing protein [Verrucomicrobiota bacterium]
MRPVGWLLVGLTLAGCSRHPAPPLEPPPTRADIWRELQPLAARYRLDAGFLYALVAAESDFNPRARNGDACGLFQLTPGAWRAVSTAPFEPTVWDWRANLTAGVDYLAYSRAFLYRHRTFSYPLLLAAFHYGVDYVAQRGFDPGRIPAPPGPIYRRMWDGNLAPVPPP